MRFKLNVLFPSYDYAVFSSQFSACGTSNRLCASLQSSMPPICDVFCLELKKKCLQNVKVITVKHSQTFFSQLDVVCHPRLNAVVDHLYRLTVVHISSVADLDL